ncbi:MAG: VOC family protein [Candidatus Bathyarchaeia archaeon]
METLKRLILLNMEGSKIKLKEISQVCVVVKDLEMVIRECWEKLGIGPWKVYMFAPPRLTETYYRGKPAYFTAKLALAEVGSIMLEIIQPLNGESIYTEFLRGKGGGLHHIACFKFDSLEEVKMAIDEFEKMGIDVIQRGNFEHTKFYYLDTEKIFGFILEVVYAPPPEPKPDYIYP